MKKWIYVVIGVLCFACNSEDAFDCLQTSGDIIQQEFPVADFDRILVNRDIELIVKQGANYEVIVETGTNLVDDIEVSVVGDQLILTDNNTCNFVRDYGVTKVFVTTPTLTEIRCSTQFEISSDGILAFDELRLVSENFNFPDSFPIGDFKLQLDVEEFNVISNNISFFYITGEAENANINFSSGNGRFEGENFVVQNINVFHRGSNDMVVNPQQSLTGTILSTGNVISVNQPTVVDVQVEFNGQLIFN